MQTLKYRNKTTVGLRILLLLPPYTGGHAHKFFRYSFVCSRLPSDTRNLSGEFLSHGSKMISYVEVTLKYSFTRVTLGNGNQAVKHS